MILFFSISDNYDCYRKNKANVNTVFRLLLQKIVCNSLIILVYKNKNKVNANVEKEFVLRMRVYFYEIAS